MSNFETVFCDLKQVVVIALCSAMTIWLLESCLSMILFASIVVDPKTVPGFAYNACFGVLSFVLCRNVLSLLRNVFFFEATAKALNTPSIKLKYAMGDDTYLYYENDREHDVAKSLARMSLTVLGLASIDARASMSDKEATPEQQQDQAIPADDKNNQQDDETNKDGQNYDTPSTTPAMASSPREDLCK